MPQRHTERLLAVLNANWQTEIAGQRTYAALAARESDPVRISVLHRLASAEQHHADLWAGRIAELGGDPPVYTGPEHGDADRLSNRVGGMDVALRRIELDESHDIARYSRQLDELGDEPSRAILREAIEDEKQHYQMLSSLIRERGRLPSLSPEDAQKALDDLIARRDAGRPRPASWIGDAIYGINDGLGAIFGIVSGVSGATQGDSKTVLLAGLAGMIASALSMGSGAYLAAKSEREIYEAEYERERKAVEMNELEAREILSLTYQVRGLSAEDSDRFVEHIARDKQRLVQALARERLDTTEEGLAKPWVSATSGALSTAVGAFVPIVPFFFMTGVSAVIAAAVISLVAHFAVGAAKSLITIRSWWSSGIEMTLVGAVEGAVTYAIGLGLGRVGA